MTVLILEVVGGLTAVSQQDLNHDVQLRRFASKDRPPRKEEEAADLTARGKELASKCWQEDEEFLAKDKIAEWLGGQSVLSRTAPLVGMLMFHPGDSSTRSLVGTTWTSLTSQTCV